MTLVIGVLCENGVVMCSDGLLVSGIKEPSRKIRIIENKLLVGYAGSYALSCDIESRLNYDMGSVDFAGPWHVTSEWISSKVRDSVNNARKGYGDESRANMDSTNLDIAMLLGYYDGAHFQMCCLKHPRPIERAKLADCSTFSIGSGSDYSVPFLTHLRKIWFGDNPISIAEAKLLAIVTMKHVIHVAPYGIAEPVQLAEIRHEAGESPTFVILDKDDVESHLSMAREFSNYIGEFPNRIRSNDNNLADIPEIT